MPDAEESGLVVTEISATAGTSAAVGMMLEAAVPTVERVWCSEAARFMGDLVAATTVSMGVLVNERVWCTGVSGFCPFFILVPRSGGRGR